VSQVIQWIKTNLVIVICIAVIMLSLLSLLWPTAGAAASLREQVAQREQVKQQAQDYISRRVTIPAKNPGEPPRTEQITVNDAAVAQLRRIFADMNDSYRNLEDQVVAFNKEGPANTNPHVPMLEGVFPDTAQDSKLLGARTAYKQQFVDLYRSLALGELPPGQPPTPEQVTRMQQRVQAAFAADVFGADVQNNPQLKEQVAKKTLEFFVNRAQSISIYCPPTRLVGDQLEPGVFAIGEWALRTDLPSMSELWRGQMNYWIQQDLIAAIRVANYSPDPVSVAQAPVKRILSIDVIPGYVGLTPRGAEAGAGDFGRGATRGVTTGAASEPAPPDDLNQPLKRDFTLSHTGRRSNSLYDVRHATMSVLVDARQLPRLLNAFGRVNLMTPIVQRIIEVDQAADFREGYFYGSGVDVVQVDLLIETLWLREWTAGHHNREQAEQLGESFNPGLMPDAVRYRLSLPTRQEGFVPTTGEDGDRSRGRGGEEQWREFR